MAKDCSSRHIEGIPLLLKNKLKRDFFQYTRYDNVGVALGARGALIANKEDLTKERFEKIFASATDGNSVVVNIVIGKSNFRDGSICV